MTRANEANRERATNDMTTIPCVNDDDDDDDDDINRQADLNEQATGGHTLPVPHHVSKADFERLVKRALAELPAQFARFIEQVPVEIRTRPTRRQLRELGMEEDELLLGLYVGRPLTERSVDDGPGMPDVIYLFQEDCELASDSEADLIREVRTTVLHEIGHHFGMDEDDLDAIGYG